MSDDREGDPFADFERPPEGDDPFDDLERAPDEPDAGDAAPTDDGEPTADTPENATDPAVATSEPATPPSTARGESAEPAADQADDDPFGSLGDPARDSDPFEDTDLFEAVDLEAVDPEQVWEELDADEFGDATDERDFAQVSKHRFCETCEHFADPPAVGCTHDGTRIVEFPDMEEVIVVDCPVVAEQRRLENQTGME
jgi:hypothetical protein